LKIGPKQEDLTKFGDPTPYNIMFGPDKCGGSSRTHLIFNYDGKNILKTRVRRRNKLMVLDCY
jgi:calreticulin